MFGMNGIHGEDGTIDTSLPILPTLDLGGYKDELNLAEFPIAALTDRVPDGQTTLVFEDKLEQKDGNWTITQSPGFIWSRTFAHAPSWM